MTNKLETVFVGRQAMFDRAQRVVGYELLSRESPDAARAVRRDPQQMTVDLLSAVLFDIGVEELVGARPAYVNVTPPFLSHPMLAAVPVARMVLELVDVDVVDDALIKRLVELRREGCRFALDDYVPGTHLDRLLPYADLVKISLASVPRADWPAMCARLREAGVIAGAKRVESIQEFAAAKDHFDVFQGFFFQRPELVGQDAQTTDRTVTMRLLAELADPEVTIEALADIINRDPALTSKVLQFANSGFANLKGRVDSVHRALVMLGHRNVKNMMLMAAMGRVEDKPRELLTSALIRAKTCELLATGNSDHQAAAFTAGLLSLLDVFLGISLEAAVEKLPLTEELRFAIVDHTGPLGMTLRAAIACERWDLAFFDRHPEMQSAAAGAYLTAVQWTENLQDGL